MSEYTVFVPQITPGSKYTITGPDCQILTVHLNPGEKVECEPGSMIFMHPDMKSTVRCGSCTRCCTGESCCISTFTNGGGGAAFAAFTPNFPSKIVPVDLNQVGGSIIAKGGSYMSHYGDIKVIASFDCCSFTCCCGGLGMIRQKMAGTGTVFLTAGGTVVTRTLSAGETIIVDETSLVGFQETAKFGIKRAGGCCTMCLGGEGLFNATVTGPGLVIIQSMGFERYRQAVLPKPDPAAFGNGEGA